MAVIESGGTRLGCGRDLDDLWQRIDQPPDVHEQSCEQCQAARRDLAPLAEATNSLRTADHSDESLQPRSQLTDSIMAVARAEVRRGRRVPLRAASAGPDELTISEQTVSQLVRDVCDRVPGIEARRVQVLVDPDVAPAPDAGSPVRITLSLSASSRLSLPTVTAELRESIMAAVDAETGLSATGVEITVEDLHDV